MNRLTTEENTALHVTCIRYSRTFRHTHLDVLQNESPVCTLDRPLSFLGTQKLVYSEKKRELSKDHSVDKILLLLDWAI